MELWGLGHIRRTSGPDMFRSTSGPDNIPLGLGVGLGVGVGFGLGFGSGFIYTANRLNGWVNSTWTVTVPEGLCRSEKTATVGRKHDPNF